MTELGIVAMVRTRVKGKSVVVAGSPWPASRKLRNLRWVGGTYPKTPLVPGEPLSPEELRRIFHESIEQERRDAGNTGQSPKNRNRS